MAKRARTARDVPGVEWVRGSGDFIRVDPGLCSGCGDCTKVCFGECYEMKGGVAKVRSLDKCMECGYCWYICPTDAIEFSLPVGGTGYQTRWG